MKRIMLSVLLALGALWARAGTEPGAGDPAPAASIDATGREGANLYLSGGNVLPQVADGGYWKTTIVLHNNSPTADTYDLYFYNSDGQPLTLDFVGLGSRSQIQGNIPGWGTVVIETQGTAETVKAGWASMESGGGYVLLYAIFRQQLPWRPYDFEAVVPGSSSLEQDYVLAFDNTQGYTTSVAVCNTNKYFSNTIAVTIYDESGTELSRHTLNLPKLGHAAFATDVQWPSTINKRGTIRFQGERVTVPFPAIRSSSALGLRFNWTGPFTSTHTIEE